MTTTRKARARKALRYGRHIQTIEGCVFPPVVSIAYAHRIDKKHFPLVSRRQWKRWYHR